MTNRTIEIDISSPELTGNYNIVNIVFKNKDTLSDPQKVSQYYFIKQFMDIFVLRTLLYFDQVHDFLESSERTQELDKNDKIKLKKILNHQYKSDIEYYKTQTNYETYTSDFILEYYDLDYDIKQDSFNNFYNHINNIYDKLSNKQTRDNLALLLLHMRGTYEINLYENLETILKGTSTTWNCNSDTRYLLEFLKFRYKTIIKNRTGNIIDTSNNNNSFITVDAGGSKYNMTSVLKKLCNDFTRTSDNKNYFYSNLATLYDSASSSSIQKFINYYKSSSSGNNFTIGPDPVNKSIEIKIKSSIDTGLNEINLLNFTYVYVDNVRSSLEIKQYFNLKIPKRFQKSRDSSNSSVRTIIEDLKISVGCNVQQQQQPNIIPCNWDKIPPDTIIWYMAFKTLGDFGQIVDFYDYSKDIDIPTKIFSTFDILSGFISSIFNYGTILETATKEFTFPLTLFTNEIKIIYPDIKQGTIDLISLGQQFQLGPQAKYVLKLPGQSGGPSGPSGPGPSGPTKRKKIYAGDELSLSPKEENDVILSENELSYEKKEKAKEYADKIFIDLESIKDFTNTKFNEIFNNYAKLSIQYGGFQGLNSKWLQGKDKSYIKSLVIQIVEESKKSRTSFGKLKTKTQKQTKTIINLPKGYKNRLEEVIKLAKKYNIKLDKNTFINLKKLYLLQIKAKSMKINITYKDKNNRRHYKSINQLSKETTKKK